MGLYCYFCKVQVCIIYVYSYSKISFPKWRQLDKGLPHLLYHCFSDTIPSAAVRAEFVSVQQTAGVTAVRGCYVRVLSGLRISCVNAGEETRAAVAYMAWDCKYLCDGAVHRPLQLPAVYFHVPLSVEALFVPHVCLLDIYHRIFHFGILNVHVIPALSQRPVERASGQDYR